ncbi:MAG TPA: HEAT repeat domain-containing protein [Planctomycetota bacterium]|jgi:HEAT repeat protein|nr:HEAT repeat domain-containing protein [Planctomycetota bacterium]
MRDRTRAAYVLLFLACACRSAERREPYKPPPATKQERAVGVVLTTLDNHLVAWNLAKLETPTTENLTRLHGIEVVIRTEARAQVEALLEQLRSGPPRNRRIAAAALGFAQDPRAVEALLEAAGDADGDLANNALVGLGALAAPSGPRTEGLLPPLEPLFRMLEESTDGLRRTNAAFAIKRAVEAGARCPALRERLVAALADGEGGVRAQCAAALGALGDAATAEALLARSEDPDPVVRASAAFALGCLRVESARGRLEQLRLASEPGVREAARSALRLLDGPASRPETR